MGRGRSDVGHQYPLENLSCHLRRELCDCHRSPITTDVRLGFHLCQVARLHADASFRDPQRGHVLSPWGFLLRHVRLPFPPFLLQSRIRRLPPRGVVVADGDARSCTKRICITRTASTIGTTFRPTFTSRISPTLVNLTCSTIMLSRSRNSCCVRRSRASSRSSPCPSGRAFCSVDTPKTSRSRGLCRRPPLCCSTGCAPRSTFYGTHSSFPFWHHVSDSRGGALSSGLACRLFGSPKRTSSSSWEKTCSLVCG